MSLPSNKEIYLTLRSFLVDLIDVFSASNKHMIVGRDKEEELIVKALRSKDEKTRLLYICGHPGQGKTVVLDQVLNDHFRDKERLVILKYNAMVFRTLH